MTDKVRTDVIGPNVWAHLPLDIQCAIYQQVSGNHYLFDPIHYMHLINMISQLTCVSTDVTGLAGRTTDRDATRRKTCGLRAVNSMVLR